MERLAVLYATALFDIAKEKSLFDDFLEQAQLVHTSLQDEACQKMLAHPHIPAKEKQKFFKKAFGTNISEDLLGLLFLAADKNREKYILPALEELSEMIRQHKNIVKAEIFSATALNKTQTEKLKKILESKLNKTVEMEFKIDSSLIGGPYIFVDGYYIDWTIKKKIYDLTVHMKEGCSA